jgi:hypothetical protein
LASPAVSGRRHTIVASIAESNGGDFSRAFYIAIAISLTGAVMSVAFRLITRKRQEKFYERYRKKTTNP